MSDFSLTLVLHFKTSKSFNGMAKVQIKSEKLTPFGGIFSIMEQFDSMLSPIIDQTLGQRCRSIIGCLVIQRQKRMDGVLDLLEGEYTYRCILTNDYDSSTRDIVEFYNKRGGKERIFDDMNNGFGWNRLPKLFMAETPYFFCLRH